MTWVQFGSTWVNVEQVQAVTQRGAHSHIVMNGGADVIVLGTPEATVKQLQGVAKLPTRKQAS